jgi:hypothetical protein
MIRTRSQHRRKGDASSAGTEENWGEEEICSEKKKRCEE